MLESSRCWGVFCRLGRDGVDGCNVGSTDDEDACDDRKTPSRPMRRSSSVAL